MIALSIFQGTPCSHTAHNCHDQVAHLDVCLNPNLSGLECDSHPGSMIVCLTWVKTHHLRSPCTFQSGLVFLVGVESRKQRNAEQCKAYSRYHPEDEVGIGGNFIKTFMPEADGTSRSVVWRLYTVFRKECTITTAFLRVELSSSM